LRLKLSKVSKKLNDAGQTLENGLEPIYEKIWSVWCHLNCLLADVNYLTLITKLHKKESLILELRC